MRRDHGVITLSTNKGRGSKFVAQVLTPPWNGAVNAKAPVRPLGLGGG